MAPGDFFCVSSADLRYVVSLFIFWYVLADVCFVFFCISLFVYFALFCAMQLNVSTLLLMKRDWKIFFNINFLFQKDLSSCALESIEIKRVNKRWEDRSTAWEYWHFSGSPVVSWYDFFTAGTWAVAHSRGLCTRLIAGHVSSQNSLLLEGEWVLSFCVRSCRFSFCCLASLRFCKEFILIEMFSVTHQLRYTDWQGWQWDQQWQWGGQW